MYSDMSMRISALLVVEQELGQRLGQLGLADAGGPEEQERADRPVRVLQAGAGAAHRVGDRAHRLVLADDARAQVLLHLQQLLALALQHLVDRDAGPARHDAGDVLGRSPPRSSMRLAAAVLGVAPSCFSSSGMTP